MSNNEILLTAESGFLTDICLQQSVHSDYLLRQAIENHLALAIPEYAFAEVDGGLQQRLSEQKHQLHGMNAFANELLRRRDTQQQARQLKEVLAIIQKTLQTALDNIKASWQILCKFVKLFHSPSKFFGAVDCVFSVPTLLKMKQTAIYWKVCLLFFVNMRRSMT